jgi:hypothetical protein
VGLPEAARFDPLTVARVNAMIEHGPGGEVALS